MSRKMSDQQKAGIIGAVLLAGIVCFAIACLAFMFVANAKADCLVHFSAKAWCPPCRQMEPEVKAAQAAGVDIREVDFDENRSYSAAWNVKRVPTTIYVKETPAGNYELERIEGVATARRLQILSSNPRAEVK